jgi:2-oxoglutarate ferredoxin oxidoreductase subunit beta
MKPLDTSRAPAVPARKVETGLPSLLLTGVHQMRPGCGEPLAVRQFLETIEDVGVVQRAIAVVGIGCYTSFSGTIDVDLVQALHGRAPSVATGVKRMLPDAVVFTMQGDGDMVNEGLQELGAQRGRGGPHTEDVQARVRDAAAARGLHVRRGADDVSDRVVRADRRRP